MFGMSKEDNCSGLTIKNIPVGEMPALYCHFVLQTIGTAHCELPLLCASTDSGELAYAVPLFVPTLSPISLPVSGGKQEIKGEDYAPHLKHLRTRYKHAEVSIASEELSECLNAMYLAFSQPITILVSASVFACEVYQIISGVKAGELTTYGQIAKALGRSSSSRAVGNALARNEVSFYIPCHRVVRGDGQLGGYRWGVELKRRLTAVEARTTPKVDRS